MTELAAGTTVGRYRIDRVLGAGKTGVVYAAFDPELDRRVALKLLAATFDDGDAMAVARLRHPNVAAVHDVGSDHGRAFVVMELVIGEPLGAWARAGAAVPRVLATIRDAGAGLAAAHAAGIVHGNFSADHVLVDARGRAAIIGFAVTPRRTSGVIASVRDDVRAFCAMVRELLGEHAPARLGDDMTSVLAALRPPRRRIALAIGLAAVVIAGAAAVLIATRSTEAVATCDARRELAGVWDDAMHARVAAAFRDPLARHRAIHALDRYAATWIARDDFECRAPTEHTDGTLRCLRDAKAHLRAVTERLAVDPPDSSDELVAGLRSIESCDAIPEPADLMMRIEVDALRDELSAADGQTRVGNIAAARSAIESLAARAAPIGYRPLLAEIEYVRVLNLAHTGVTYDASIAALRAAAAEADASGNDVLAVQAWLALASETAEVGGDLARGREYLGYTAAALERAGKLPEYEAQLAMARATVDERVGHFDDAIRETEHAVAISKPFPELHREALHALAGVEADAGHLAKALDDERELLPANDEDTGAEAMNTYTDLGTLSAQLGRPDDALGYFQRAADGARTAYGPTHPATQGTVQNLGEVFIELGRYGDAERELRRAVDIGTTVFGPDATRTAQARDLLGVALAKQGKYSDAIAEIRRALAAEHATQGETTIDTLGTMSHLGAALRGRGELREALEYADAAIAGYLAAEPNSDDLDRAYIERARTLVAAGRTREARDAIARATELANKLERPEKRLAEIHELEQTTR